MKSTSNLAKINQIQNNPAKIDQNQRKSSRPNKHRPKMKPLDQKRMKSNKNQIKINKNQHRLDEKYTKVSTNQQKWIGIDNNHPKMTRKAQSFSNLVFRPKLGENWSKFKVFGDLGGTV